MTTTMKHMLFTFVRCVAYTFAQTSYPRSPPQTREPRRPEEYAQTRNKRPTRERKETTLIRPREPCYSRSRESGVFTRMETALGAKDPKPEEYVTEITHHSCLSMHKTTIDCLSPTNNLSLKTRYSISHSHDAGRLYNARGSRYLASSRSQPSTPSKENTAMQMCHPCISPVCQPL